ncbi:hypothetical protein GS489_01230 [Rhodococcus hoagii]|nr:hypothetical protein [Prescottella equi]
MTDATVTLTILDGEASDTPPSHESMHAGVDAAVAALEAILRDAGEGDQAVQRDDESTSRRRVYDLLDSHCDRVGIAVIEQQ